MSKSRKLSCFWASDIPIGTDCKTWYEGALPERLSDAIKTDPFFAEAEKWAGFDRSLRGMSPTPVKPRISPPRDCEVAYDADGKGSRHPDCTSSAPLNQYPQLK